LSILRNLELGVKWGHLPVLEFDGRSFSHSFAIGRYLARKYGLVGSDEFEEFKIDEYIDQMRDYFTKWVPLFFESTQEEKKQELKKTLLENENPRQLGKLNAILVENSQKLGSPWLVGKKLSWADILLANCISNYDLCFDVNLSEEFPAIQELIKLVFNTPGIKEWIEKRPNTKY
jgi:glutathione S-transferase